MRGTQRTAHPQPDTVATAAGALAGTGTAIPVRARASTRALGFADGILRVEVADAGWRRELANLAPRYLALVNKYSAIAVKRIEFVVKV